MVLVSPASGPMLRHRSVNRHPHPVPDPISRMRDDDLAFAQAFDDLRAQAAPSAEGHSALRGAAVGDDIDRPAVVGAE